MNKFVYVLISLLLIAGIAFAVNTPPTVEIIIPSADGNYLSGTQGIVFTVLDSDGPTDINANIYYSNSAGNHTNQIDINFALDGTSCDGIDFKETRKCSYNWDTTAVPDGNYYIDVNVITNLDSTEDSSDYSFRVDNTPPSVTVTDVNGDTSPPYWATTGQDVNVTLNLGENNLECKWNTDTITDFSTEETSCTVSESTAICNTGPRAETTSTSHSINYMCKDLAGNLTSSTPLIFGNDYTAPDSSISASVSNNNVTVTFLGSDAHSEISKFEVKVDSGSWIDKGTSGGTHVFEIQANGDHTYYLKVTDNAGKTIEKSEVENVNYAQSNVPTGTPTISSDTHENDEWITDNDPKFDWDSVDNATEYRYALNDESNYDLDDEDNDNYDTDGDTDKTYSNVNDGIYWFHVAGCNSYGCGSTDDYKILIDKTGPDAPKNLFGLSHSDGSIYLKWDEPEDNPEEDNSGVKEYIIYRSITRDFGVNDSGVKEFEDITDTDYTDEYSLIQGIAYYYRVQAIDELENKGTITTIKRVLNSGNSCGIELIANIPEIVKKGELKIDIITSEGTIYNAKLKIKMPGENFETLKTGQNGSSIIDTYEIKEGINGTASIIVEGYDENDKSCEQLFEFEVDSINPEIEIISPKNNAEISEKITIQVSATDEGTSIEKIEAFVNDISIGELEKSGAFYELDWSSTKNKNGDYKLKLEAEDKAGNTAEKEITIKINNITGTLFAEEEKTFDNVDSAILKNAGLKEELLNEAMTLIKENTPKRKFTAQQTTNGIEVKLTITLKNTGSTKTMSLIEVIPKILVENAGLIISNKPFKILQEDPVIQFDLGEVASGKEVTVNYTIASGLSNTEASELEKAFNEFNVSPILLETQTESPIQAGSNSDNLWLIFLVIVIIFLLIVGGLLIGGGALFFHQKSKKQTIQSKGLHTVYENKSNDGFFSDLFKKEDSEKRGKFAYQEK